MDKRDRVALQKIVDEAKYIEESIRGVTVGQFTADETLKRAVTMSLINIGELTNAITEAYKAMTPQIQWSQIRRTRDKVAHHYIDLDPRVTWETVSTSVPKLAAQIEELLNL
jgi:uncharacterized protein with HEPN domain